MHDQTPFGTYEDVRTLPRGKATHKRRTGRGPLELLDEQDEDEQALCVSVQGEEEARR